MWKLPNRIKPFERYFPVLFFIGGVLFDILTLERIDHWFTLVQHVVYLTTIGVLLTVHQVEEHRSFQWPHWFALAWRYSEHLLHFLFGSLLSAYTYFYVKSTSFFSSFVFVIFLASLLIINELPRFHKSGPYVKFALYGLCLTSYFAYLIPVLIGFIGVVPFAAAIGFSLLISWLMVNLLIRKMPGADPRQLRKSNFLPSLGIQVVFALCYFMQWVPPVPLSLSFIGVYHDIQKEKGEYTLQHLKPWWRFWQSGDQLFMARPGDRVFCFARIFSPSRFKEQMYLRWMFKDPRLGWMSSDRIPLETVGGRDEGFRGYAYKSNYQPGFWRVQVETADGRELGRIYFSIHPDDGSAPRQFKIDHG